MHMGNDRELTNVGCRRDLKKEGEIYVQFYWIDRPFKGRGFNIAVAKNCCFEEVHLSSVVLVVVLAVEHKNVHVHHSLPWVCDHTFRWRHQMMFGLVDLGSHLKC
jgi:hypothetical protein